MPAKQTLCVSVTIRPREGITTKEVSDVRQWVEAQGIKASAGTIERPGTIEAHLHAALLFDKMTTAQQVDKKLKTLFKKEIDNDLRWEHPKIAIKCVAHHNFNGLVGGYFSKEAGSEKVWMFGITEDELELGKEERDEAISKSKNKKVCSPSTLIYDLRDWWDTLNTIYEFDEEWKESHPHGATCQECFTEILTKGQLNYLIHWGRMKKQVEANWLTIIASERTKN